MPESYSIDWKRWSFDDFPRPKEHTLTEPFMAAPHNDVLHLLIQVGILLAVAAGLVRSVSASSNPRWSAKSWRGYCWVPPFLVPWRR